jgi:hypothetical protein
VQVRAILDQKGLPRRLVQLSCTATADVYIDSDRVVGVDQVQGGFTVRLHTDRASMFILVEDYRSFIEREISFAAPEFAAALR